VKKAAIFGSRGQLGIELVTEFAARGYEVASFDRSCCDITDAAAVQKSILNYHPDVVLNAAAYNKVDDAETDPQAAYSVNAFAVRNLALASRAVNALLVHYSTDYVFDGNASEPYTEQDPPGPLGAYAVSKLAGEHYARAYTDALVIRVCGVFGPSGPIAHGNFVETMLKLAASGKPFGVVESIASPTYAPAIAARTADLVEKNATGLFHIGGGTPISWHDWAAKILQAAGIQAPLKPDNNRITPARRPRYSALSNRKMEALGIAPLLPLDDAIREYLGNRISTQERSATS
jgi:dTDP-4-dehydrorhamnose reductase